MFLFKASAATYMKVVRQSAHAFRHGPPSATPGTFVLLSMNKEDCTPSERQIRHFAKIKLIRSGSAEELEQRFPGVDAAARWNDLVELYWLKAFDQPFSLSDVPGLDSKRYDTVQGFSRFMESDSAALITYFGHKNTHQIVEMLNCADIGDP